MPTSVRPSSVTDHSAHRVATAKVLGVAGVVAYNWWVVVPFVPGLMPSVNGFFSDLEATGRPHASQMADADLVAGILLVTALFLRGSPVKGAVRREWKWMVAFAVAGAVGGRYTYACSEGLSAACRAAEWHLQLPIHHYVHVVSGIAEFATLTTAAVLAMRRTRNDGTGQSRLYRGVVITLAAGYPLLAAVYLTDRLGTLVEPIFFVAFSVMVLAEIFESVGNAPARPTWAQRVAAREWSESEAGIAQVRPMAPLSGAPDPVRDGPVDSVGRASCGRPDPPVWRPPEGRVSSTPPVPPRVMRSSTQSRGPMHVGLHNGSPRYRA